MRKVEQLQARRQRWRRAVAAVLAETRTDADVTQKELARRIGWTRNIIAKMEGGNGRHIELGDIVLIAEALGTQPDSVIRRILTWNE